VTVYQILPMVTSFVKQLGRRLTDDELRALLDALGPEAKKKIKGLLNTEAGL